MRAGPWCERKLHLAFVGGGAVDRWDGHVIQAQINRELATVMNCVIDGEAAQDGDLRHGENLFAAAQQRPGLHEFFVASTDDGGAGFGDVFVEYFEQLFSRSHEEWLIAGAADRTEIERVLGDCGFAPAREFGHVTGEAADGHGFFVRLPIRVAFRDAFEDRSRSRHLVIEFRKNAVAYRHGFSPVIDFVRSYGTPKM
jgi:hypothetical protein